MSLMPILDGLLALSVLGSASLALMARRAFAAVIAFLLFGLITALIWARLNAPDVALAEAAIGAGVTGALFLVYLKATGDSDNR